MNKKTLLLILFLLVNLSLFSQEVKQASFEEEGVYDTIDSAFTDSDATLIFQNIQLVFAEEKYGLETRKELQYKLIINTKAGLETYSKLSIPKNPLEQLTSICIRTIKKNNKVINLNITDIKEISLASEDNIYNKQNYLTLSIPSVEIGDEIEIKMTYKNFIIPTSNDIYLHTFLPCLTSKFTLITPRYLKTDIKHHNNLTIKEQKSNGEYLYTIWEAKNLSQIFDQEACIPSKEVPYFTYALRAIINLSNGKVIPIEKNSWAVYIDEISTITEASKRKTKSLNIFFETKFPIPPNNIEKLKTIANFQHYINDSISIVYLDSYDSEKSILSMLNKGEIDSKNLLILYDRFFEYLQIDYSIGAGRNKYDGPFDMDFITSNMITNSFISFQINEFTYFLFLKNQGMYYELGEIPIELQGTEVVIISKKAITDRIKKTKLEYSDKNENYRKVKSSVKINLEKKSLLGEGKRTYAGSLSLRMRSIFHDITNNEIKDYMNNFPLKSASDSYTVDSVFFDKSQSSKIPYMCTLFEKFHIENSAITTLDSNLYSISLNDWISHNNPKSQKNRRTTDYYNYQRFYDNVKYYITFDKKVNLIAKEDYRINKKNEFGSYELNISQINENTILVESNYETNLEILSKDKYFFIHDLEEEIENANNMHLKIKVIN